jgi:putative ABC transport system permease protein
MRSLFSHLRHTVRRLAKSPGFTITAILILGLGIGANTAIFSLVNGVLLKPLPYPHSERLVELSEPTASSPWFSFDYPDFEDYRANQHSFDSLAAFLEDGFNISGRGEPERVSGWYVSGDFFRVLGRPFLLGRPFGGVEDRPDLRAVVVISEHLWRTRFAADPNIVGANLTLDGKRFQVVGVTPPQANEEGIVDLFVPLGQSKYFGTFVTTQRGSHNFGCMGRIRDGITISQAQADLEVIRKNLADRYPATNSAYGIRIVPYLDSVVDDYSPTLWLLEGAVACLLLITCANVANLLLARTRERRREISIRVAIGANRLRIITQVLAESVVLAVAGSLVGVALSYSALRAIKALTPSNVARFQEVQIDAGALLFVLIITVLTALFSGLFPALINSRTNLATELKQESDRGGTTGRERHRGQALLVVGQVALTSILLIGAGLLARSFQALQSVPLGFDARHVLTADLYLTDANYKTQAERQAFFDKLLDRIVRIPGVTATGLNTNLPFRHNMINSFGIAGRPDPEPTQWPELEWQMVSPDYFKAAGIPILLGRAFSDQDGPDKDKVVIINESIAKRFFPGEDPIGKQLHDFADLVGKTATFYTIVGVAQDVQHQSPESQETPFQGYYPYPQNFAPDLVNWGTVVIRTEGDPHSLIEPLSKLVEDLDPNLPISNVNVFDDLVARAFATKRLATIIVGLFSGAALLLTAVGLYGVLSYSVAQRKREIGVRIALGAQLTNILHLVIKQGLRVVGLGLVIGLATALALSHTITGILYGVSANDFVSIGLSIAILSLVSLIACLLPALRATSIDPLTALPE